MAQVIFQEDFEKGVTTTPFLATDYFKTPCNSSIVKTTNGVICSSYTFQNELTADVSGKGYFLFHATPYKLAVQEYFGTCWGTVTPVAVLPNTFYQFSFYLANAFDSNFAEIQPVINGEPLSGIATTTGIGIPSWKKFTFCWFSANKTTAILELKSLLDTPKGNDFALDNIVFEKINGGVPTITNIFSCDQNSFTFNNITYTKSGSYTQKYPKNNSCDSVFTLNLFLKDGTKTTQNLSICPKQKVTVGKNIYTQTGNYIDTLKSKSGCDSVIFTNLKVENFINIKKDTNICFGQKIKFGIKEYSKAGIYNDTLLSKKGCDTIFMLKITLKDTFSIKINKDTVINEGQFVFLTPIIKIPSIEWEWTPSATLSCSDCQKPKANPLISTIYYLKGKDIDGCLYSGKVSIGVNKICNLKVFIPNVFSPNSDGINENFTIFSNECIEKVKSMRIFDRWGNLIFEDFDFPTNDSNFGWNGTYKNKPVGISIFTYYIEIEYANTIRKYKGDISTLR